MSITPVFPPLFSGLQCDIDPFFFAQERAQNGCAAGVTTYNLTPYTLNAAIVFTPDVPLKNAIIMLPICGVGFQNALGALAPPEVAVHLTWDGIIKVNGGRCGTLRAAASTHDPSDIPDWLVIGLSVDLWPASDNPGKTPDITALYSEGCADVDAVALLEAWVRHTLVWINRWSDDGTKPIYDEWQGLADGLQSKVQVNDDTGKFSGVDEDFAMLLHDADETKLIPLTDLLTPINKG